MAHRVIIDAAGVTWEVWEVHPTLGEKRGSESSPPPPLQPERRKRKGKVSPIPGRMRSGWLAMMSKHERRRIFPVPTGWDTMTEPELLALVASAESIGITRRLVE